MGNKFEEASVGYGGRVTVDEMKVDFDGLFEEMRNRQRDFPTRMRKEGYKSTEEWSEEWHVSKGAARRMLRSLFRLGRLEHCFLPIEAMDGSYPYVPCYKILPEKEE